MIKNIKDILGLLIIVGIIGAGIFLYAKLKEMNDRNFNNYQELLNQSNNKILEFTKREFKYLTMQNDSTLRMVLETNNIKPGKVQKITKNTYVNNYDTAVIIKKDTILEGVKHIKYTPDDCVKLEIRIEEDTAYIDSLLFNYNSTTVYYKERLTKSGKKIFFPFGRSSIKGVTVNNCTGKTSTEEIVIE